MRPDDLDRTRADLELRWAELRRAMSAELGLRLRRRGWWILLLAGTVGMALASRARTLGEGPDESP